MSRKDTGPVIIPIAQPEEWGKLSGDAAERDYLAIAEVYVTWCGPSEAITSTIKKLQTEYAGRKLKFYSARRSSANRAAPTARAARSLPFTPPARRRAPRTVCR